MKTFSSALIVVAVAGGAFLLGRTTAATSEASPEPGTRNTVASDPSPTPPTQDAPREHRSILRYFAMADEQGLPKQGILGGTMIAGTIAFSKGFGREEGERFFVVGSDGHLLETWTYEVKNGGTWKFIETQDGYAPVDFEDHLDDYVVYLWRPAFYVPAEES